MGDISVTKDRYKSLLKKLLPRGKAWEAPTGSILDSFLEALAYEPARVEERGYDFLGEMSPLDANEMLDDWERLLALPDECTPTTTQTITDRRLRAFQKLTTGGGQSRKFFQLIASQLGYNGIQFTISNYKDFRVGQARIGDPLSNSTNPDHTVNANGWAFAFKVTAPAGFVRKFRVGRSSVGERMVVAENPTLECVMRKLAPAHASLVFSYTT